MFEIYDDHHHRALSDYSVHDNFVEMIEQMLNDSDITDILVILTRTDRFHMNWKMMIRSDRCLADYALLLSSR
jgi:hypothetical protein